MDQTDADQWTALHFAALRGWQEGIRVLLDKGANPNAVTGQGSTALQVSVWYECWLHSNTSCTHSLRTPRTTVGSLRGD